jgi:catechol 2,3-dioxygenase
MMDCREDVLRAADILTEAGIAIETGPHKHSIGQTFFLYFYEPGGNRIEVGAGGYLIFDPDHQSVVWNQEERKRGQAWGLATVSTFHTYGTPPADLEDEGKPTRK